MKHNKALMNRFKCNFHSLHFCTGPRSIQVPLDVFFLEVVLVLLLLISLVLWIAVGVFVGRQTGMISRTVLPTYIDTCFASLISMHMQALLEPAWVRNMWYMELGGASKIRSPLYNYSRERGGGNHCDVHFI